MGVKLIMTFKVKDPSFYPELRADSGLASGCAHLQSLVSISAANTLKEVIDEVKPADSQHIGGGDD